MNSWLGIMAVLLSCLSLAGQNLILNGSFELYSECPFATGQIELASAWSHPLNHGGSADFFHSCSSTGAVGVPDNAFGSEQPDIGEGYAGMSLIFYPLSDFREYLVTKLFKPMEKGKTYKASFRYSLADNSSSSTGQLSIAFPDELPQGDGSWGPIYVEPAFTVGMPPEDKEGWILTSFSYTATGGEQYMIVGNFNNDANTPTFFAGNFSQPGCYVYLDDFDVVPCAGVDLGPDTVLCIGGQLVLNAGSQDAIYRWQNGWNDSLFIVTTPGVYWVEVTNDCGKARDSIEVNIQEPVTIIPEHDTSVCKDTPLLLSVSTSGVSEIVWQGFSQGSTFLIDEPGSYWVRAENDCGVYLDTIVIMHVQCDCPVYIPNIFSPNGDQINDVFAPVLGCPPAQYKLVVYDRTGNNIHTSLDPNDPWDGMYKGRPATPGVYAYSVTYLTPKGEKRLESGAITLIR